VTEVESLKIEIAELNKQLYNMYNKVLETQKRVSSLESLILLQRQINDLESKS
jgi:vacuolar-type H+-ATPase subunit D/Vma8